MVCIDIQMIHLFQFKNVPRFLIGSPIYTPPGIPSPMLSYAPPVMSRPYPLSGRIIFGDEDEM